MIKLATCPKCGRRDAEDITVMGDEVRTVMCRVCGQQPPDPPEPGHPGQLP